MSPTEATKLLDLPADATPEQVEARFLELRRKLEEKIAHAPTSGLQAKYRETLGLVTIAFETLTLASEADSLPLLPRSTVTPSPAAPPQAGPREKPAKPAPAAPEVARPNPTWRIVRIGAVLALLAVALIALRRSDLAESEKTLASSDETSGTPDSTSAMSQEQMDLDWWIHADQETLLRSVHDMWARLEQLATEYENLAARSMETYRTSSGRTDVQQAHSWAFSRANDKWARKFRTALSPAGPLAKTKRELEAIINRGEAHKLESHRLKYKEFEDKITSLVLDEPDGFLEGQVSLTSDPSSLKWTIESNYGGTKTLRVSGTTPTDESYRYLGSGKGTLRIQHPGKPDFVVPLEDLGNSNRSPVTAHAVFK